MTTDIIGTSLKQHYQVKYDNPMETHETPRGRVKSVSSKGRDQANRGQQALGPIGSRANRPQGQ